MEVSAPSKKIRLYGVKEEYEVIEKVGKGTYGTVFKVKSLSEKKSYAIKKLENNDPKILAEGFPVTALRCKNCLIFRSNALEADEPSQYHWIKRDCFIEAE